MVRWPSEQEMRSSLASEGRPRLLLLEDGPPPVVTDPLEDWIRLPADDSEMWARLESLRQRWEAPRKPKLDGDGVLTWADGWVALSNRSPSGNGPDREVLVDGEQPQPGAGNPNLRRREA